MKGWYAPISIERCISFQQKRKKKPWLKYHDQQLNADKYFNKAVSISLFLPVGTQLTVYWKERYLDSLKAKIPMLRDTTIIIHISENLKTLIPELKYLNSSIEFKIYDKTDGLMPGMLWRFLSANDKRFARVFIADADTNPVGPQLLREYNWIPVYEEFMDENPNAILVRRLPHKCTSLIPENMCYTDNFNYNSIEGATIGVTPRHVNFSMRDALEGFKLITEFNIKEVLGDTNPNYHRLPQGDDVSDYKAYGFDERFTKQVLYYHFGKRGALGTVDFQLSLPNFFAPIWSRAAQADFDFINTYSNPHLILQETESWLLVASVLFVLLLTVSVVVLLLTKKNR
tara:strand:- start:3347 stop:4375 length:1029 start_codon:yes stop_codon:yes gene_type:complete